MDNRPSPPVTAPAAGDDGFDHPASEDELVALVRMANQEGRLIDAYVARRIGLTFSIYADPLGELPEFDQLAGATERDQRRRDARSLSRLAGQRRAASL